MKSKLPWIILVLLAIFVLASKSPRHYGAKSAPVEAQLRDGACKGKARCVGVYVTPWCPACEGSLPFIHTLQRRFEGSKDVGMVLIIGQDSLEKLDAFAARVGGTTIIDADGAFASASQLSGFPTWFVWDEKLKILSQKATGAPGGEFSEEELVSWFFSSLLGLNDSILLSRR